MYFFRIGQVAFSFIFAILLFAFFLPNIISTGNTARFSSTTQPLSCTTGAAATSCNVLLKDSTTNVEYPSANTTMEGITVLEQSPGTVDRTTQTTLSNDQSYLVIAGLTGGQTYNFSVTWPKINDGVGTGLNQLLRSLPLLVVIGMAVVLVLAGGRWLSAS
tara:strand:+ start:1691 stop:2173 length:483 start_codon:yes stop_codon:yes gene_type:complete